MSRAFVKEIDDAPDALPDRPVSAAPNRVTPRGAQAIRQTVATLAAQIAAADADAAAALRRDLRYWLARQASMQLVPADPAPREVGFGTRVSIRRGGATSELTIVGEDEAHPAAGLIAWTAPLARALDGARPGETVDLDAAGRSEPIVVLAVNA